MLTVLPTP
ncbi:hypothetical protein D047_4311A, partial [Vibrio parahaemolyticus VPTS-2010_2]